VGTILQSPNAGRGDPLSGNEAREAEQVHTRTGSASICDHEICAGLAANANDVRHEGHLARYRERHVERHREHVDVRHVCEATVAHPESATSKRHVYRELLELLPSAALARSPASFERAPGEPFENVKAVLGTRCMGCALELSEVYGAAAQGIIDVHHLLP
jgi:hypothetical protein